jgi:hypothetical protein
MDYDKVELLSVSGKVTLDDKPLPNAVVTFEAAGMGTFSYGMTDEDGEYTLRFDSNKMGCTPGEKRVEISTSRKILGLNSDEEGADPDGGTGEGESATSPAQELVPERFNRKSELRVTVNDSATDHDFQLTSQ